MREHGLPATEKAARIARLVVSGLWSPGPAASDAERTGDVAARDHTGRRSPPDTDPGTDSGRRGLRRTGREPDHR
jgi:hypothetical protein